MCGLVGITSIKDLTLNHSKFFRDLLIVDTLRGPHSTGMFSVNDKGHTQLFKKDVDGFTFTQMDRFASLTDKAVGIRTLAGHNRWATKGVVNYENAHPFEHGDIIMMHNGTLLSERHMDKPYHFGTDSECIAYNISILPPEDVGKLISKIDGAYALVWYDKRDKSLNFIRNSERELYLSVDDAEKPTIIGWASEQAMLDLASQRSRVAMGFKESFIIKPMHHIKCKFEHGSAHFEVILQKYKEYVPPKRKEYQTNIFGNSGVTTGSNSVVDFNAKKSNREIRKASLPAYLPNYGEEVNLVLFGFNQYNNINTKGCIEALYAYVDNTGKQDYLHVELHNTSKEYYESLSTEFKATVSIYNQNYTTMYASAHDIESENTDADDELSELNDDIPFDNVNLMYTRLENDADLACIPGPYGTKIDVPTFDVLTKNGCSYCTAPLSIVNCENIHWTDGGDPLCDDCGSMRHAGLI